MHIAIFPINPSLLYSTINKVLAYRLYTTSKTLLQRKYIDRSNFRKTVPKIRVKFINIK